MPTADVIHSMSNWTRTLQSSENKTGQLNSPARREALLHETLEADLVGGRLALRAAAALLALVAVVEAERRCAQRATGVQLAAAVWATERRRRLAERAQLVQRDATVAAVAATVRPAGRTRVLAAAVGVRVLGVRVPLARIAVG